MRPPLAALALSCLLLAWFGPAGNAQAPRVLLHLDGQPAERSFVDHDDVRVQGRGSYVHGPGRYVEGVGALSVQPGEKENFYGVSFFGLELRNAEALVLSVFQEGTERVEYKVHIFDGAKSRTDAAVKLVGCSPGWSDVRIELRGLRNYTDTRDIDVSERIRKLEFSRPRGAKSLNPPFLVDNLRAIGEDDVGPVLDALQRDLRAPDGQDRAEALRKALPFLPEPDRVRIALERLKKDRHDRVVRAARDALTTLSHDASAKAVIAAVKRARDDHRIDLLAALAGMPSPVARDHAFELLLARGSVTDKTALLTGIKRRGFAMQLFGFIDAFPDSGPWQPRAALASALAFSADAFAIDGLIRLLKRPGSGRVATELWESLVRLTGKDMGENAGLWASWWDANRDAFVLDANGRLDRKREGYGRGFFGIPVPEGRLAFVLDTSGSMRDPVVGGNAEKHIAGAPHLKGREIKERLDLAKAELVHALSEVRDGSYVAIILYNDDVTWVTKGFEKVRKGWSEDIVKKVELVKAKQKTNIHDGLFAAFHPGRKPGRHDLVEAADTIYLLSDGNPSVGPIAHHRELRDAVLRWNLARAIRIHTISVGNADRDMLRQIAAGTGGTYVDLWSETPPEDARGK